MLTILIILAAVILFFSLILFFRKVQYDHVHLNLQKLVDAYGGEVVRTGRIAMPVYHGKYKNGDLVINFSNTKANSGDREYYATFSYDVKIPVNVNIISSEWLQAHPVEQNPDVESIVIGGFRISSSQKTTLKIFSKNPGIIENISGLKNLVYFFTSVRGAMFEIQVPNTLEGSRFDILNDAIVTMHQLIIALKKSRS